MAPSAADLAPEPLEHRQQRWRWALLWLAVIAVHIALYPALFADLANRWTPGSDLEQGLLLLVLTLAALFWPPEPQSEFPLPLWSRALLLAGLQTVLLVCLWLSLQGIAQFAAALSVPLAVSLIAGPQAFAVTLRASLIVLSAFPVFYLIGPLLQHITVAVSTGLMRLLDVQVHIHATYFELGTGIVEVAEGCSGLKYFVSALGLVAILNVVSPTRWPIELYRYGLGLLLAMACNWIRVSYLIQHADWYGVDSPLLDSHDFFGWIVFGAMLLCFDFATRRTEPWLEKRPSVLAAHLAAEAVPAQPGAWRFAGLLPIALVAAIYLWPLATAPVPAAALPEGVPGYPRSAMAAWSPSYENTDQTRLASYGKNDGDNGCQLVAGELRYARPRQGAELLNGNNVRFSREAGWREIDEARVEINGAKVRRTVAVQDSTGKRRVMLWWYQVGARAGASRRDLMLGQLRQRVQGRIASEALLFVGYEPGACAGNEAGANALVQAMWSARSL